MRNRKRGKNVRKRSGRIGILAILLVMTLTVGALLPITCLAGASSNESGLKTVRVGYLIYEGFQEGEGDEPKSGYGYEYLQQIAYFSGWKYEYVNGSFHDLLEMLKNGEIDIMGNISYTEERAQYIDYATEEQGREYYYLFVREDRTDITAADLSTLNGMHVGINKGSVQAEIFEEWCKENQVNCEIKFYDNSKERYEDMNSGRLDATISTNVAAKDIVKFRWNSLIKIGSSPYYFATNKQRPDILEDLNAANAKIQQSDWYYNEKVYLKYYGKMSASAAGLNREDLEWMEKKNQIIIGYMDNMLPYSDCDEKSGELLGLLPSFIEYMKERYDIEFLTKEFNSYEQMNAALCNGGIDTMFPTYGSYWIAEKNNIMVTDALATSYVLMIYSGNYGENTASAIAITDKSSTQRFFAEEYYSNKKILKCKNMTDCIRAVIDGKASCTLMSSDFYYANRNELESLGEFSILNTGYETSISFATRKEDIEMYSFMKKCVSSITEGEVNEALIASRHAKTEPSVKQFLQKHIMIVLIVIGIIFALIFTFLVYYVISSRKALRLVQSNCELNEKAYIDLATGLPNKNKCAEMTASPLAVSSPTACFMLDLNDLKVVNDTLGHEMGDLMILNFAKLLRQTVPSKYFVGRFGGDEFIVIAEKIADRNEVNHLVEKIGNIVFEFNGASGEFRLNYACGYAFSEDYPSCSVKELLEIADQNMYEDKKRKKADVKKNKGSCV